MMQSETRTVRGFQSWFYGVKLCSAHAQLGINFTLAYGDKLNLVIEIVQFCFNLNFSILVEVISILPLNESA